ncbi:MAG TPA: hypothetical protein ENI74_00545 [Gammaproteobacteria bacterium]|nr:hypothetical protein [Gammaproteobacteria bacterium]
MVALCLLGPSHLPPSEDIQEQFQQITEQYLGDQCARILEFAVAFGCGKWRAQDAVKGAWYDVWEKAIGALGRAMEPAVREINQWLSDCISSRGYPKREFWDKHGKGAALEARDVIESDALYLALRLIDPVRSLHIDQDQILRISCTEEGAEICIEGHEGVDWIPVGGKLAYETATPIKISKRPDSGAKGQRDLESGVRIAVFSADSGTRVGFSNKLSRLSLKPGESAELYGEADLLRSICTCGHEKCSQKHRLDAWEPSSKITLWSYAASAVKGLLPLKVNSFIAGMYYGFLSREGGFLGMRIRVAQVEFRICQTQACGTPDKPFRYEGARCPKCETPGLPETTRRVAIPWLFVISDVEQYRRTVRYHCTDCDNLSESPDCPLCSANLNAHRPTHVWANCFPERLGIEGLEAQNRFLSLQDGMIGIGLESGDKEGLEDQLIREAEASDDEFLYFLTDDPVEPEQEVEINRPQDDADPAGGSHVSQ